MADWVPGATFFGYRITDKLIWNSECQVEFLHYKSQEIHHEIVIEHTCVWLPV